MALVYMTLMPHSPNTPTYVTTSMGASRCIQLSLGAMGVWEGTKRLVLQIAGHFAHHLFLTTTSVNY